MIRVSFLPPDLARWEGVSAEALCLSFFSDERPLRGAAGLADWRLCGALSRCVIAERMRGDAGEVLLMPAGRRLPFPKVFLFGLGPGRNFSELRYRDAVRRTWDVVRGVGVRRFALAAPGRAREAIPARRALELLLGELSGERDVEVLVIEALAAQKEMAAVLRQARA
ncbi:MAG: M17 family peptidase N-terminal domain-containing protein [Myxococcota bacterium]